MEEKKLSLKSARKESQEQQQVLEEEEFYQESPDVGANYRSEPLGDESPDTIKKFQKFQDESDAEGRPVGNEEIEMIDIARRIGLREKEMLDTFVLNEERLRALMTDEERQLLPAHNLIIFRNKADDIIGAELDTFVEYLAWNNPKKKTKYYYQFNEIKMGFMRWLDWSYKERNRDQAIEEKEREEEEAKYEEEKRQKEELNEKMELRRKGSLDMLNFKLKKHKLKIQGIFKRYSQGGGASGGEGEEEPAATEEVQNLVRIDSLPDIFNDFAYICAIVFSKQREFLDSNNYMGIKVSSEKFQQQFEQYLWKYLHYQKYPPKIIHTEGEPQSILKPQSDDGYFDTRNQDGEKKQRFDDEAQEMEKEDTFFDYKTFKAKLREFMQKKKVIGVDLNEEYSKKLKKRESATNLVDLRGNLQKTISEYEQMLKNTEDEQQRQKIDKIILQLRRELSKLRERRKIESSTQLSEYELGTLKNPKASQNISVVDYQTGQNVKDPMHSSRHIQESMTIQHQKSMNNNLLDEIDNVAIKKRAKALDDIFHFYAKQHMKPTTNFIDKEEKFEKLEMGEFYIFIKDFGIDSKDHGLGKQQIIDIFKKASYCHMPLTFSQFKAALQMIAEQITKKKLEETEEQLQKTENELEKERDEKKTREEEHQQYLEDRDGDYRRYSEEEKKQQRRRERTLVDTKEQLEKQLQILKGKRPENSLDDLYRFMEIDDFQSYKKKIKGYCLAFSLHEKVKKEQGTNYKIRAKKIPFKEVKQMVQEIKVKREKERQQKAMEANMKYLNQMKYIQKTHDALRQEKLKKIIEDRKKNQGSYMPTGTTALQNAQALVGQGTHKLEDIHNPFGYLEIKNSKAGVNAQSTEARNLKVTLDILTKMHYQDFNQAGDKNQNFNPLDLVDDGTLSAHSEQNENGENRSFEGSFYEEDGEIDAFTKKRLPKAEDFFPNNQVPEQLKSANTLAQKKLMQKQTNQGSEFAEKIISSKNQSSKPQNHLILDEYEDSNQSHFLPQIKSVANLNAGSKLQTGRPKETYDSQKKPGLSVRQSAPQEKQVTKLPAAGKGRSLMANASQKVIRANQLKLKH